MAFRKGVSGNPAGRKKGAPNKVTGAQRHAIHEAFDQLGGVDSLVAYARTDAKGFYGIWGRTVPAKVEGPGENGEIVIRITRDPEEPSQE